MLINNHGPLIDSDTSATEKHVRQFARSEGRVLDRMLRERDRANANTSYINGPWTEAAIYFCAIAVQKPMQERGVQVPKFAEQGFSGGD